MNHQNGTYRVGPPLLIFSPTLTVISLFETSPMPTATKHIKPSFGLSAFIKMTALVAVSVKKAYESFAATGSAPLDYQSPDLNLHHNNFHPNYRLLQSSHLQDYSSGDSLKHLKRLDTRYHLQILKSKDHYEVSRSMNMVVPLSRISPSLVFF